MSARLLKYTRLSTTNCFSTVKRTRQHRKNPIEQRPTNNPLFLFLPLVRCIHRVYYEPTVK